MDRNDTLAKASEIAQAMVRINNVLLDNTVATYQPERDRVEFYLYDGDYSELLYHFRFEATRNEFVIHDVLGGYELYRSNIPERVLATWASHILEYVAN